MSKTDSIHRLIEKLIVDTKFHDELMGAKSQDEARAVFVRNGVDLTFTTDELNAELERLRQGADAMVDLAIVPAQGAGDEERRAQFASRLARLINFGTTCHTLS